MRRRSTSPWLVAACLAAVLCSGSARRTRKGTAASALPAPLPPPQPGSGADSDAALAALVQRARAATDDKPKANGLWHHVLQLSPTHYEANRAVGMALMTGGRLKQAMHHLRQVLIQDPQDYFVVGWYAGGTARLVPDTQKSTPDPKHWADAIARCDAARTGFPGRPANQHPTTSVDRFFFTHCCEIFQDLDMPEDKATCFREAMDAKVWETEGQRPADYDPSLVARPYWEVGQLGRAAAHARMLRTNWEAIRDEALAILGGGRDQAGGSASGSAVADASGFDVEVQGLHAQRSW